MIESMLLARWGDRVRASSHIWTWTTDTELAFVAEIANKSRIAVELGVYLGRSSKVILDASPDIHLWAVDAALVAGVFETAGHFLREEIREGRCEMIKGDSNRAAEMLVHMKGQVDMVWVDDGHSEADLVRDINAMLPLLRPGGILFGHDWEGDNDVARGVKRTGISITTPLPRIWQHVKGDPINPPQAPAAKCCGR